MNRAQRRTKIPATEAEVIKQVMYYEGMNFATDCIYASVLMVLHDKEGWGKVRCQRFLKQIQDQVDSVHKKYVSLDDIKETVHSELDIKLVYSSKGAK